MTARRSATPRRCPQPPRPQAAAGAGREAGAGRWGETLSPRRRRILEEIIVYCADRGYPPTLRELCTRVGLRSAASVKAHIDRLVEAGYVETDPGRPRSIRVCYDPATGAAAQQRPAVAVPVLATAAAGPGAPLLSAGNVAEIQPVPSDFVAGTGPTGALFMVAVTDDAASQDGILEGDYVVCDTAAPAVDGCLAVIGSDDAAVLRRLRLDPAARLCVEDAAGDVDAAGDLVVHGVVVAVLRAL